MSRAMTYNNPGNVSLPIKGYSGPGTIIGAPGQPGYASFPDLASGFSAFDTRLTNRINEGYNTIGDLSSVYAQDPNWKNGVSSISGIGVNTPLDVNDQTQMSALQYGIIQHESGNASAFGITKTSPFGGTGVPDTTGNSLTDMTPEQADAMSGIDPKTGDFTADATPDQMNAYARRKCEDTRADPKSDHPWNQHVRYDDRSAGLLDGP